MGGSQIFLPNPWIRAGWGNSECSHPTLGAVTPSCPGPQDILKNPRNNHKPTSELPKNPKFPTSDPHPAEFEDRRGS